MADDPARLGSVSPLADHGQQRQYPHYPRPPYASPPGEGGQHHAAPADMASVMGVPEDQLTEPVRAALSRLMAEVERLRDEIGRRDSRMEEAAYHHSVVPALNRRGLKRELRRVLGLVGEGGLAGQIVMLHVDGMDRLRLRHGLDAVEAAQAHVAARLASALRQSDLVAFLGGGDFVLLLSLADAAAATPKVKELETRVNQPPFAWKDSRFMFEVITAQVAAGAGATPDEALAAADAALLDALRR